MNSQALALERLHASRQRLAGKLQGVPQRVAGRGGAGRRRRRLAVAAAGSAAPVRAGGDGLAGGAALVALKPWRAVGGSALLARLATQWASQLPLSALLAAAQDAALSYIATGNTPMSPPARDT